MKSNRREFLTAGSVVAGSLAMASHVFSQQEEQSQPELKIGVIGVGWYGMVDARAALKVGGCKITAICDVDSDHLNQSADKLEKEQGLRPATFKLYEEMLEKADLDAVIIGSPPHWHPLQLLACLKHGLDVYCEKPLSYDVAEGIAMQKAVEASDSIVQIGFQRRQSKAFAEVKEFIASGGIGELVQVDAQIHYRAGLLDNTPTDPPAALDWDLWCGPGPLIPYSEQVGHKSWRLEKTTGHGHLVDWGIHLIDATRMMLDLDLPKSITAVGGIYQYKDRITTPDTLTAHFEFDKCPVVWRHRLWGSTEYTPETKNGIFFFGDEATVFASDRSWTVIRGNKSEQEVHEASTDLGTEHMANFISAVRNGTKLACPIAEGRKSTATVQMAMISQETGQTVDCDNIVLDQLVREYRKPYVHPFTA